MNFVEEMKKKAAALQNRIVFPEGTEERTIEAAGKIVAQKLAKEDGKTQQHAELSDLGNPCHRNGRSERKKRGRVLLSNEPLLP